jgi:hypothetical protein
MESRVEWPWARFVDEHARKAAFRDRVERRR